MVAMRRRRAQRAPGIAWAFSHRDGPAGQSRAPAAGSAIPSHGCALGTRAAGAHTRTRYAAVADASAQRPDEQRKRMPTITTTDGTEIFYKDWGSGQPIVFSHGWPLSADDWDTQMLFFLHNGYRVVAHDRRGHGRPRQTPHRPDKGHYAPDPAAGAGPP